jgi:hypothetical protein
MSEIVGSSVGEAFTPVTLDVASILARRKELQHAVLASSVPPP